MSLVVVAGATGALGRGIVDRLLSEGHEVLALARSEPSLASLAASTGVRTLVHDVRDHAALVAGAVGDARLGALVHVAGPPIVGGILEVTPDDVLAAIDVKVNGLLRLVRALDGALTTGSRVIAVGGNLGFDPVASAATPGIGNAAQANAVRQLNRALAPRGVTCYTVAPGPVATERLARLIADEAAASAISIAEVERAMVAASPLGRLTTIGEVAWAVVRLLDPEAGALAGSTLLLDTGRRTALP